MREESVAKNYAATLFELAERHEGVDAYQNALGTLMEILRDAPELRTFLATPRIAASDKKRVLRTALEGRVPALFLNFVVVAVEKRRQGLFEAIADSYSKLLDDHHDRVHVRVTVARELDGPTRARVARRLSEFFGRTAIPEFQMRPHILGGVVVRVGDTVYDGSLRRRVEELRHALLAAPMGGHGTINGGGGSLPVT